MTSSSSRISASFGSSPLAASFAQVRWGSASCMHCPPSAVQSVIENPRVGPLHHDTKWDPQRSSSDTAQVTSRSHALVIHLVPRISGRLSDERVAKIRPPAVRNCFLMGRRSLEAASRQVQRRTRLARTRHLLAAPQERVALRTFGGTAPQPGSACKRRGGCQGRILTSGLRRCGARRQTRLGEHTDVPDRSRDLPSLSIESGCWIRPCNRCER